jgi:hypothetical protein
VAVEEVVAEVVGVEEAGVVEGEEVFECRT